jgi:hypothetical protein
LLVPGTVMELLLYSPRAILLSLNPLVFILITPCDRWHLVIRKIMWNPMSASKLVFSKPHVREIKFINVFIDILKYRERHGTVPSLRICGASHLCPIYILMTLGYTQEWLFF